MRSVRWSIRRSSSKTTLSGSSAMVRLLQMRLSELRLRRLSERVGHECRQVIDLMFDMLQSSINTLKTFRMLCKRLVDVLQDAMCQFVGLFGHCVLPYSLATGTASGC